MSAQSILVLSREKYLEDRERLMLKMSDSYFLKTNFLLGEREDRDKQTFVMQSYRYLCTDICEMTKFIQNKLEGKLIEENCIQEKGNSIADILIQAQRYINKQGCTLDEAVSDCCSWSSTEW